MKGKRDEMNVDQGKSWKENRIEEEAKIKIGNEEEKWISGERQRMRIEKKNKMIKNVICKTKNKWTTAKKLQYN